jgi:hypothetical protein
MKKTYPSLLIIVLIFLQGTVFSQNQDSLRTEIEALKDKVFLLEQQNQSLLRQLQSLNKKLESDTDSLLRKLEENSKAIENLEQKLTARIEITDSSSTQKYSDLDSELENKTIYWITGLFLLAVFSTLIFFILKKRIRTEKNDLDKQIVKTRKDLEEEGIKLDNKLVEILNSQMKILETNKISESQNVNHSLALKVADEIVRIEKNLSNMDPSLKGHKQLEASVSRIKDNFEASGYEIVELLNKPYSEGMNASVTFTVDENLKSGEQIITRIIKPQVNFKNLIVQTAQIEVSQGE